VHSDDATLDGPWLQWHYDRWVMPPDAVEVARNAAASQVFVLRRNLALQFHPEVDAAGLRGWLEFGGCRQAEAAGLDPAVILSQTEAMEADYAARARGLVDTFLDSVAVFPHQE
jgi:GMP synthase-like glutamine amidotransferase